MYSKSGKQVKSFPSNLPGGNRNQSRGKDKYTILDCVFSESNSIFYILDMMCWDGFTYYNCDTEFRLSWIQSKFIENKDLRTRSRINPYSFQPLPVYQCTKESIGEALNSPMPFSDNLDGLLIYHREVRGISCEAMCLVINVDVEENMNENNSMNFAYRFNTCLVRLLWLAGSKATWCRS